MDIEAKRGLVVVAHPDDEVLGCGGTLAQLTAKGWKISTCILSGAVEVRSRRPQLNELRNDTENAHRILGIGSIIWGSFPNIQLNTQPHLELVQFIEAAIVESGAQVLWTHHPGDLNNDHGHVTRACLAAARLFQRRTDVEPVERIFLMEVPSSTDWGFPTGRGFEPSTFVSLDESALDRKLEALAAYRGVMREPPHPRSENTIRALARVRGSQAGFHYAEAFQTVFERVEG